MGVFITNGLSKVPGSSTNTEASVTVPAPVEAPAEVSADISRV